MLNRRAILDSTASAIRRIPLLFQAALSIALLGAVGVIASASESATAPSSQVSSDRDAALAQARAHWASALGAWNSGQLDRALSEGQATHTKKFTATATIPTSPGLCPAWQSAYCAWIEPMKRCPNSTR
jgi:hypothetical protein